MGVGWTFFSPLNTKQPTNLHNSGSLAVFKVTGRDQGHYKGPSLHTVTFLVSYLLRYFGVVRRCWVNFQCRGVLLIWITVGQGPIVLAVGAGGVCLDIFSLIYRFSFLSPSLWETVRYRLKYCLKGPLSPKQPTNQSSARASCSRCGWGLFGHFYSHLPFLFFFSLFLGGGPI